MMKRRSSASSTCTNFYFRKILNSQFLVVFQSFVFGKFWQFWADFVALAVAVRMPKVWLKSLKSHNLWTMSPNVTCRVSLKSYHPYPRPQKVSKILKIECIHGSLPKITKSHCPLGVNVSEYIAISISNHCMSL